jgi:hypothetical protein
VAPAGPQTLLRLVPCRPSHETSLVRPLFIARACHLSLSQLPARVFVAALRNWAPHVALGSLSGVVICLTAYNRESNNNHYYYQGSVQYTFNGFCRKKRHMSVTMIIHLEVNKRTLVIPSVVWTFLTKITCWLTMELATKNWLLSSWIIQGSPDSMMKQNTQNRFQSSTLGMWLF